MKKLLLLLISILMYSGILLGQSHSSAISTERGAGSLKFYQNDQQIDLKLLVNIMRPNEQAYNEIKTAESTYGLARILNGAGGFMIGWPIGTAIGGGEPMWALAGVGAGLIIISIPLHSKFNRQAQTAVNTFNSGLPHASYHEKSTEWHFRFTGNGVSLSLRF